MVNVVELSGSKHADLKLAENSAFKAVKSQHIVGIKVTEVTKAVSDFPIFFTQINDTADWTISAITSLEPETNLFVQDSKWDAVYLPSVLRTYPFFLMKSDTDEGAFTVGIDEDNQAFSTTEGVPIFTSENTASDMLTRVTQTLQEEFQNDVHTFKFASMLNEHGLMREVDVRVHYQDGNVNSLKGLYTVDEEKFQNLGAEEFLEFKNRRYLAPMYGMLMSIYQLNSLMKRHNDQQASRQIKQVNIEVAKDPAGDTQAEGA